MAISVPEPAQNSRRDHLLPLAESANETARMGRINVSLTLIAALYLTLTLLTATDENLLRNTAVALPQLEIGISLEVSFIFAPLIFVYLHAQTLFQFAVLARKIKRFERALVQVYPDEETRNECRDWLSAFSLVQGLVRVGKFASIARVFTWLAVVGFPLLLLLLIDISFLRYQSAGITGLHHACFIISLASIWVSWRYISPPRSCQDCKTGLHTAVRAVLNLSARGLSVLFVVFLWAHAWPVPYVADPVEPSVPKHHPLLRSDDISKKTLTNADVFRHLLCPVSSWRGTCRTLSLPGGALVRRESFAISSIEEIDSSKSDLYRRLLGVDLQRRSLRYSDLQDVYLVAARLAETDLRGAKLRLADLSDASLTRADLSGANLSVAKLMDADLTGAKLMDADLTGAKLIDAYLTRADLSGANLSGANLSVAKLMDANLTGAKLMHADLTGAKLMDADLSDANLLAADLSGTNLSGAKLMDANLTLADLPDANLSDADLTGAILVTTISSFLRLKATLTGTVLTGANLTEATVTQAQLNEACGDGDTQLPKDRTIPHCDE